MLSETKVKVESKTSVMLLPNGSVCCFDANEEQMTELNKSWIVTWLESLEAKGIDPLSALGKIETVINGELVRIKPFKKEGVWGYETLTLDKYSAWEHDRRIELNTRFSLIGFNSEKEMDSWIRKYMDGDTSLLFFSEGCAYKGLAEGRDAKDYWVERKGKMDSGGYWYKSYCGDVYCKNHYQWSFESALKVIGNPKYIIVMDKSKINQ